MLDVPAPAPAFRSLKVAPIGRWALLSGHDDPTQVVPGLLREPHVAVRADRDARRLAGRGGRPDLLDAAVHADPPDLVPPNVRRRLAHAVLGEPHCAVRTGGD